MKVLLVRDLLGGRKKMFLLSLNPLVMGFLLALGTLASSPSAHSQIQPLSCHETLAFKKTRPTGQHLTPYRGYENNTEAQMKPLLQDAMGSFKENPKKSLSLLEGLPEHKSFARFSWIYIRTVETLIRDSVFYEKQNRASRDQYHPVTKKFYEILAKLSSQSKDLSLSSRSPGTAEEIVFHNLALSINTMLAAQPEDFTKTLRNIDKTWLAYSEQEAALRILKNISVSPPFAYYLLVNENELIKLLFTADNRKNLTLSVIEKISDNEPDFVFQAITKLLDLPWKQQGPFFASLISKLHNSITHQRRVRIEPTSLPEMNALLEYGMNAPLRDSELYLLNLYDRYLNHSQLAQTDGWLKLTTIIDALLSRAFGLSDKNQRTLLEKLAKKVNSEALSPHIESQVLEVIKDKSLPLFLKYPDLKAEISAQKTLSENSGNIENDEDDITFF